MTIRSALARLALAAGLTALAASAASAQLRFTILGGVHRVLVAGSEGDYAAGINDFPVSPAHTTLAVGGALSWLTPGGLGAELSVRYRGAASLTLRDPSDGDTVTIDSAAALDAIVSTVWQIPSGRWRPYVAVGGGVSSLVGAKEQRTATALGYPAVFSPPDKTLTLMAEAGAGIVFVVSRKIGLRLDARYTWRPSSGDSPAASGFAVQGGLVLALSERPGVRIKTSGR